MNSSENIKYNLKEIKTHTKASEKYVDVTFKFKNNTTWNGWIPIEYRRAGLFLETPEEIEEHIKNVYEYMNNVDRCQWLEEEKNYWATEKPNADITKSFFDELAKGGWRCSKCQLPTNPNFTRRIQDLKEFGYLLATDTKRYCIECEKNTTHIQIVPIKRLMRSGNGYETWSLTLRKKIISTLNNYDVYEGKKGNHLLPDHKFPEIRWSDDTKSENPEKMTNQEIKDKFQLLSNQRNLQKREICRECYQTNKRGFPFGIKFYYSGGEVWNNSIPAIGKAAEEGCIGCGWYDMEEWRKNLTDILKSL